MLHLRCVENTYVLPKGIVWFLCQDGRLFRLDMQKFRDGGEGIAEHPMKGKRIYRIHQDADGNEWLLTDQGIEIVGNRSINAPDLIFRHIKERNGHTYLVSEGGELFVFRQQKGDFERLATPGSSEPVTSLKNLGRDTLLLQTPHSLTFYACKSGTASTFHTADVGRAESTINQVHTDKKGICWILLNPHEMLRLNPQTGDSRLYALPPSTFRNRARQSRSLVFNDPHGMLWVIPEHEALCYYDAGADCFRTYLRNLEDPSSSYVPFIRYSLLDRQGNLWYAPYTGLEKVSFLPHFFTLHTLEKEMDIRSFLNDRQGNLWVGSQNGTLRIYQHGDKRPLYVTPQGKLTTQPSAFPGGAYALLQARNGDIWLGTKEAGLYRLRPSGARHFTVSHYTPEPGNPYSLSANSVYALCEDSRGRIWVGTFGGGLNLVQEHADGQVQFIHRGNVLKGFPLKDARIRCLKESPDSILLVGTTDGLIACRTSFRHPEDIIFRHHRHIGGATYLKTRIRTLIRRRQELQEFYRARFQPHPEETAAPADAESAPTAYEPKRPQLESLDDRFMEQVMECIEQNMDNQDFEIETLAEHLFMSRTVFYRKLKSITGMTPVAFVGEMRIKRALQLMEDDGLTISQVAYMTGFNSPKYFSKVFKKAVGCTPSEYKEQKKGNEE